MQKCFYFVLLFLLFSCTKEKPNQKYTGIVIGKLRSGGGGIGLSMHTKTFSNVSYKGTDHVVEALNIPNDLPVLTFIQFEVRNATAEEKNFIKTADGFEGAPIIYITNYTVEKNNDIDTSVSECILGKIDTLKSIGNNAYSLAVNQYYYKGKICYLFLGGCCDMYNILVDNNCNIICAPSGGVHGGGDGRCPDFDAESLFIREVWRK